MFDRFGYQDVIVRDLLIFHCIVNFFIIVLLLLKTDSGESFLPLRNYSLIGFMVIGYIFLAIGLGLFIDKLDNDKLNYSSWDPKLKINGLFLDKDKKKPYLDKELTMLGVCMVFIILGGLALLWSYAGFIYKYLQGK